MDFMRIEDMTIGQMDKQRACYRESIARLKKIWNKLDFQAKHRAGHTLINLHEQMSRLDLLQSDLENQA